MTDRPAGYLDPAARRAVEVLFEAILPGDDSSPGATDAGAVEFLDRQLAADESSYYEIAGWRRAYAEGLPALEQAAGRPVGELSRAEATELLRALSKGELSGAPEELDQRRFFATLRNHCIEGCFSDPRWGGNRDAVVWRWFGYIEDPQDFERGPDGTLRATGPQPPPAAGDPPGPTYAVVGEEGQPR